MVGSRIGRSGLVRLGREEGRFGEREGSSLEEEGGESKSSVDDVVGGGRFENESGEETREHGDGEDGVRSLSGRGSLDGWAEREAKMVGRSTRRGREEPRLGSEEFR